LQTQNTSATPLPTGKTWAGTVIYDGATQTVPVGTYNNLTFSGAGVKTTAAGTLTIGGNWAVGSTTNLNTNNTIVTLSGAASDLTGIGSITQGTGLITVGGNWTNTGTFTASSAGVLLTGAAKTIATGLTFTTLTVNGTYTNNGTLTVSTSLAGSGTLTQAVSSILNIGGTSTISGLAATVVTNTVNYNGAAQTVKDVAYNNLTLSGSGVKTLPISALAVVGDFTTAGTISTTALAAITVTGNVAIGAGTTFDAGPYTHNVGGSWSNLGTFTCGTGTITFIVAATKTIAGTLTGTTGKFNNITFNAAGTWSFSNNADIAGNFTITAGTVQPLANLLNVGGNWINGGTFTPGTSTFTFNGTSTQSITGATAFYNLTVNKSSGGVTLIADATVNNILTLTSGNITTGANILIVANNEIAAVSRTSGQIVGNLRRLIATGSPAYTFDVGTATSYTPVNVAFTTVGTAGYFTALVNDGQHPQISTSTVNTTKDVNKYWNLVGSGGLACTSYAPTFTYNSGDIIGGGTQANFIVGKYPTGGPWTSPAPTPVANAGSGPYTTQITGQTALTAADFVVGEANAGVVLSDNAPQVAAASVGAGTNNLVLHKSALTVSGVNATLTGLTCTTAGTYVSADIINLKVYYSTNSAFSVGTSTLLSTLTTPGTFGLKTFPAFSQVIPLGINYIYITADVAAGAVVGNTINVAALTASNFTITGITPTGGPTTAGGIQTFGTNYYNVSGTALNVLTNWGTNTNGSGTNPTDFALANQVFNIYNGASATITGTWTATLAKVVVGDGTNAINFTIPAAFALTTAAVDVSNNATLTITNVTTYPTLGALNPGSTVIYNGASAQAVAANATYGNLTFSDVGIKTTAAGTLSIAGNWAAGSPTALNTSNTIVNLTGNLTGAGNITQGTGLITVGGNWTNTGTFTATSAGVTLTGAAKSITGAAGLTFTTLTVNGTYTNNNPGTLTVSTALAGSGTLTQATNATLAISGTSGIANLVATADPNTVIYNSAGAQTIAANNFSNLTVSGTRGANLSVTLNGIIGISGIFDVSTLVFSGSGAFVNTGSTVNFNGAAQTIPVVPANGYNNLTLSGSGIKTMPSTAVIIAGNFTTAGTISATAAATFSVTGNVTIGANTIYNPGPYTHNVGGSWLNNGTFTCGTGTITFTSATGAKTIAGTLTGATGKFNNITFNAAGPWSFSNDADIAGNFTITTGTVTAPANLYVGGSWSNAGTFTNGTGTVTFNSTATGKTIAGT
ncbi:MAG: hypothetical protein WC560_12645, partial [Syntrophales bacterium]